MKESWYPIPGYEGIYEMSNMSRIRSLDRMKLNGRHWGIKKGRILKIMTHPDGYTQVVLIKNGVRKRFLHHRLVAIVFIPNPQNKCCVNHLNRKRDDNRIENLEWCTTQENTEHAKIMGSYKNRKKRASKK